MKGRCSMAVKSKNVSSIALPDTSVIEAVVLIFSEIPPGDDGRKKISKSSLLCRLSELGFAENTITSALNWLKHNNCLIEDRSRKEIIRSSPWGPTHCFVANDFYEAPKLWALKKQKHSSKKQAKSKSKITRYKTPPCPKCGGKRETQSKDNKKRIRKLKCLNCGTNAHEKF
jgi:predicted RNA-binding Zn-ribbon protein involved in translation (DUF1610 family)